MKKHSSQKIVSYDKESDVLYIGVKRGLEEEFVEISPGINVELDDKKRVIGIEILNASRVLKSVVKPLQREIMAPMIK